jgi:hypothetical protein
MIYKPGMVARLVCFRGKMKQRLDPRVVNDLIDYDPETGIMTYKYRSASYFDCEDSSRSPEWRAARWNSRHAGKPAFTCYKQGYLCGTLLWQAVSAHRIAFCIFYGAWPEGQVDHINGNRSDNRIDNLRSVSQLDNSRNMRLNANNKSGTAGVYWNKLERKWKARINTGTARISLGSFRDLEDAIEARKNAEAKYGYHANHGRTK